VLILAYRISGFFVDQIATNSSWTNNHILELWRAPTKTRIIYPPVDTTKLQQIRLDYPRKDILVSFAQFRPEKEHDMQLRIWAEALKKLPTGSKFYMVGSARD